MDAPKTKRCPHFQIFSEQLEVDGPPVYLAIRRCLLSERLIALIRPASQEGNQLADKMIIRAANGKEYAFVGPDLEAVTQRACTFKRCDERCTPAYKIQLQHFNVHDPREDEVTCRDEEPDEEASEGTQSHETPHSETCPLC